MRALLQRVLEAKVVVEGETTGEINKGTMSDLGLFDLENEIWLKPPTSVRIGNSVTSLGVFAFSGCSSL